MDGLLLNNGNLQIDLSALTDYDIKFMHCPPTGNTNIDISTQSYSLLIAMIHYDFNPVNAGYGYGNDYCMLLSPTNYRSFYIFYGDANSYDFVILTMTLSANQAALSSNSRAITGSANIICIP